MSSAKDDEVSLLRHTDTNVETGMTGKGGKTSNMMDLVGRLKRKDEEKAKEKAENLKSSKSHDKKKGKEGKKSKKGKNKYKRRHDLYEPDNYLLRVEGSVCCAFIISLILWILYNLIVLLIVVIWSRSNLSHLHFKEKIDL